MQQTSMRPFWKQPKKEFSALRMMKEYSENYRDAGGQEDFSNYYIANYGIAKFNE